MNEEEGEGRKFKPVRRGQAKKRKAPFGRGGSKMGARGGGTRVRKKQTRGGEDNEKQETLVEKKGSKKLESDIKTKKKGVRRGIGGLPK